MIKEKDKEALRKMRESMGGRGTDKDKKKKEEREIIDAITSEDLNPSNLVSWAEKLGRILVDRGLKSAKLRRIYDPITVLKTKLRAIPGKEQSEQDKELENVRASLLFLKPKLRSESKRERGVEPLALALEAYIDRVISRHDVRDYENFVNFFEAIVGYHKGFGGRD